jgi:hypothetical protein
MSMRTERWGTRAAILILAPLLLLGCRDTGGERALFEISGKLVVFNYRVATATHVVTLKPLQPMRDGEVAIANFEDPAGGETIVVRQKVWPKLGKVTLETPPLFCIVKDRPYAISIRIEEEAGGKLLQEIKTTIVSSEDQSLLPDRPLVVGPTYTPNPELAGRPDGKLDNPGGPACPTS